MNTNIVFDKNNFKADGLKLLIEQLRVKQIVKDDKDKDLLFNHYYNDTRDLNVIFNEVKNLTKEEA